ncbi:MAG: hypothetical protein IKP72_04740 [Clostridia bacterium]|nr:hypothetical protein [Clostridia bacterium]
MSFFELGMIVCFGISWPISVLKSIRTKSTVGKSIAFSIIVFVGYILGIIHKLKYSRDFVLYAYLFNLTMVGTDIVIYFINYRRDKQRGIR